MKKLLLAIMTIGMLYTAQAQKYKNPNESGLDIAYNYSKGDDYNTILAQQLNITCSKGTPLKCYWEDMNVEVEVDSWNEKFTQTITLLNPHDKVEIIFNKGKLSKLTHWYNYYNDDYDRVTIRKRIIE